MSYYNPANNCGIRVPTCNPCLPDEPGRVRGLIVMLQSFANTNPDFTQYLTWTNMICNQQGYWFPFANGTSTSNTKMIDGYGAMPQRKSGVTYELKGKVSGLLENVGTFNDFQNNNGLVVGYTTATQIWLGTGAAMITHTEDVSNNVEDIVEIGYDIKFFQKDNIIPGNFNSNVIGQCIDC